LAAIQVLAQNSPSYLDEEINTWLSIQEELP
jgi:hypothetical protein